MIRNIGLFIVSILIALLVAEFAARFMTPYQRGVAWYHYDERYEFRHRSNMDAVTTDWGEGEPWRLVTNSRGFRGKEWDPGIKGGRYRLVVIGDSFTLGDGVEGDEVFTSVAGQQLGPSWEVINLGVSAWGPENALAYLETEGADIDGDCLLHAFFSGNDYKDHARSGLYALHDGELVKRTSQHADRQSIIRRMLRRFAAYDFLIQHSQLFNLARNFAIREMARGRNVVAGNLEEIADGRVPTEERLALLPDDAVNHTNAVMSAMKATAAVRFGAFGVLIIPGREEVSDAGLDEASVAKESHKAILDWCGRSGTNCLDLQDRMFAATQSPDSFYFKRDFHLNSEGNQWFGRQVADNIRALCDVR